LSGPGAEALLQLAIAILNSSLENKGQEEVGFSAISSINLMMESHIKCGMKGIPQVIDVKTLLIIILDGFDGR